MTIANLIILSHKVQNPLTANDYHTLAKVITTQKYISHKTQNPLTIGNYDKPPNQPSVV
jgi:hypothetical protein